MLLQKIKCCVLTSISILIRQKLCCVEHNSILPSVEKTNEDWIEKTTFLSLWTFICEYDTMILVDSLQLKRFYD